MRLEEYNRRDGRSNRISNDIDASNVSTHLLHSLFRLAPLCEVQRLKQKDFVL